MITFETRYATYEGADIDAVTRQIMADNKKRNIPLAHKPFPEDYNLIYNHVRTRINKKGGDGAKIERSAEKASVARRTSGRPIKFTDAVRGANAILKMAAGQVVDKTEMDRRAAICTACPKVSLTSDCVPCKMGKRVASIINGIRKMAGKQVNLPKVRNRAAKSMYCDSCQCSLMVMIPAKIKCFNEPEDKNQARPDNCWAKRGSENYIGEAVEEK